MRSVLIGLMSLVATSSAFAGENNWIELGNQNIWMGAPANGDDVRRALNNDLTNTMRKYYPSGENISNYSASGNGSWTRVSFSAKKKVAVFTKTADVVAIAKSPGSSKWCSNNAVGSYYLEFDLSQSSSVVSENAKKYALDICVYPKNDGSFTLSSRVWMQEGSDFGGSTGKPTQSLLRAQAFPMLLAITKKAGEYAMARTAGLFEQAGDEEQALLDAPVQSCNQ